MTYLVLKDNSPSSGRRAQECWPEGQHENSSGPFRGAREVLRGRASGVLPRRVATAEKEGMEDVNDNVNEALTAGPEQLPCTSYTSNLGMLKQGKATFGLGLGQRCIPKNFLCR